MIHHSNSDSLTSLRDRPVADSGAFHLAAFAHELRDLGRVEPDPAVASSHLAQMRAAAQASETRVPAAPPRTSVADRGRIARRAALGAVSIPLVASGLAVAGVDLPDPASDAFEAIGIELPNQSSNAQSDQRPAAAPVTPAPDDGSSTETTLPTPPGPPPAPAEPGEKGSPPPHAGTKGKPGHPGTPPPHANGQGKPTSPPNGSHEGVGAPGTPPPHSNGSNGVGPAVIPPGQGGTPPGQSGEPPGQTGTPPGHGGEPPGQTGTPLGHGGVPPGQGGVPPGQSDSPAVAPPTKTPGPPPHSNAGGNSSSPPGHSNAGGAPAAPADPVAPPADSTPPGHGGTPPGQSKK